MNNATPPKILYVDDDSDDSSFLLESFAANASTDLVYAPGGEEAISYLDSMGQDGLPSLIILDLNMPRFDGRQTLNYIKSKPQLADIPVVILSTSESSIDKEVCARLGAASYLQKPYHYDGYKEVVRNCLPLIRIRD